MLFGIELERKKSKERGVKSLDESVMFGIDAPDFR